MVNCTVPAWLSEVFEEDDIFFFNFIYLFASGQRAGNRGGGVYEEKAGGQPQGGDEATN